MTDTFLPSSHSLYFPLSLVFSLPISIHDVIPIFFSLALPYSLHLYVTVFLSLSVPLSFTLSLPRLLRSSSIPSFLFTCPSKEGRGFSDQTYLWFGEIYQLFCTFKMSPANVVFLYVLSEEFTFVTCDLNLNNSILEFSKQMIHLKI